MIMGLLSKLTSGDLASALIGLELVGGVCYIATLIFVFCIFHPGSDNTKDKDRED